jgi:3-methyladenine DNA glycosylase Mpg
VRRRTIVRQRAEEAKAALLRAAQPEPIKEEIKHEEKQETRQERPMLGPKQLCPYCKKVPARFFHVKACAKKAK